MTAKEALRRSGENLQRLRNQKGFSIEALAVLSGVDAETITAMETGVLIFISVGFTNWRQR